MREKPCASTAADKAEASSLLWAACRSRSPLYFLVLRTFCTQRTFPESRSKNSCPSGFRRTLLIGYLTGVILFVAGVSILVGRKTRMAATYLGTWLVLVVLFVYGPILIAALADPSTGVKVEGINYFFDTMLFAGAILALASATPRTNLTADS